MVTYPLPVCYKQWRVPLEWLGPCPIIRIADSGRCRHTDIFSAQISQAVESTTEVTQSLPMSELLLPAKDTTMSDLLAYSGTLVLTIAGIYRTRIYTSCGNYHQLNSSWDKSTNVVKYSRGKYMYRELKKSNRTHQGPCSNVTGISGYRYQWSSANEAVLKRTPPITVSFATNAP